MKQHCENAEKVVKFLKKHKEVTKVIYSTEHDKHIADRAKQYLSGGNGPMIGIEVKGGIEAGKKFIESLNILNKKNLLKNVSALIIGGHQGRVDYRNELIKMIKAYELEDKLLIAHGLSKMPVAYSIANLVLSSSIEPESFGRVSVEAQSMEKPVLASDIGGSLETVVNNKTGWLFKNNDANDLASKIEMIIKTEQNILDLIGKQGRKNVKENYTRELMVSRTLEIYGSLV